MNALVCPKATRTNLKTGNKCKPDTKRQVHTLSNHIHKPGLAISISILLQRAAAGNGHSPRVTVHPQQRMISRGQDKRNSRLRINGLML
jgi:hypothetical protein